MLSLAPSGAGRELSPRSLIFDGEREMTSQTTQRADGLTFAAYPGDGAVLLAFDVAAGMEQDLAGFAVEYTDPDGQTFPVLNRLGFKQAITSATTPEQRQFFPTSEAPLQKFHWVHLPPSTSTRVPIRPSTSGSASTLIG